MKQPASNPNAQNPTATDANNSAFRAFHNAFKTAAKPNPHQAKQTTLIHISQISTPLGGMYAAASQCGICLLEFTDRKMIENQIKTLQAQFKGQFVAGHNPHLDRLESQLEAYFSGDRKTFDLPLDIKGTAFQIAAWASLQTIPFGQTRAYREQATAIGNPKAVRAVANANAKNRIAIIIPCHRVIASNGALAGFGGGVWRKRHLLDLESSD